MIANRQNEGSHSSFVNLKDVRTDFVAAESIPPNGDK